MPALNASLAKKICSAQKAENSRTLKSGEVVSVLIAYLSSAQIYPGMLSSKKSSLRIWSAWWYSRASILPIDLAWWVVYAVICKTVA